MYNIGDKVVYPMHGAGTIDDVEVKEILGQEKKYYILSFLSANMRIMVPVDKADDIGLRNVITKPGIDKVVEVLSGPSTPMANNWNRRYRENLDLIKTGNAEKVAVVVRNLRRVELIKNLSTGEKKLFDSAIDILRSEFMLSLDISSDEAEEMIFKAVLTGVDESELEEVYAKKNI